MFLSRLRLPPPILKFECSVQCSQQPTSHLYPSRINLHILTIVFCTTPFYFTALHTQRFPGISHSPPMSVQTLSISPFHVTALLTSIHEEWMFHILLYYHLYHHTHISKNVLHCDFVFFCLSHYQVPSYFRLSTPLLVSQFPAQSTCPAAQSFTLSSHSDEPPINISAPIRTSS